MKYVITIAYVDFELPFNEQSTKLIELLADATELGMDHYRPDSPYPAYYRARKLPVGIRVVGDNHIVAAKHEKPTEPKAEVTADDAALEVA